MVDSFHCGLLVISYVCVECIYSGAICLSDPYQQPAYNTDRQIGYTAKLILMNL